jgi:peptide/nickel transport system permease protein
MSEVVASGERARAAARVARGETLRVLLRSPAFLIGSVVILFWVACAVLGERIAPQDPFAVSEEIFAAPSGDHWLGTDKNGRDVLSRVLVGARDVLVIAPLATLIGIVVGSALGLVTGFFRRADDILSRIVEAVLAIPLIVLAVVCLTAVGVSNATVILVIGFVFAPIVSRTVRSAVLVERELEYIQAARLRGERAPYLMVVEILPNVLAPILVEATIRLGYAIFAVFTLSFIGFGPQPPSPDWGSQVAEQYVYIEQAWWAVLFPALAIASLVVAVNLVSDATQQAVER